jgi:DNA-binding transcriptional ArsR family regulator
MDHSEQNTMASMSTESQDLAATKEALVVAVKKIEQLNGRETELKNQVRYCHELLRQTVKFMECRNPCKDYRAQNFIARCSCGLHELTAKILHEGVFVDQTDRANCVADQITENLNDKQTPR